MTSPPKKSVCWATGILQLLVQLFNEAIKTTQQSLKTLKCIDTELAKIVKNRDMFQKKAMDALVSLEDVLDELPDDDELGPGGYEGYIKELSKLYLASCREAEKVTLEKDRKPLDATVLERACGLGGVAVIRFIHKEVVGYDIENAADLSNMRPVVAQMKASIATHVVHSIEMIRDLEDTLAVKRRVVVDMEEAISKEKATARKLKSCAELYAPIVEEPVQKKRRTCLIDEIMRHHSLVEQLQAKVCPAVCPNCSRGPNKKRRFGHPPE